MKAEDINEMRDRNCPPWLCDAPTESQLQKRIAFLEAENARLVGELEMCGYNAHMGKGESK
jgi:hypothetical protein